MARNSPQLTLQLLPHTLAVCRLAPDHPIPDWLAASEFYTVTRTDEELSVVCEQERVPVSVRSEPDWRALKVVGPLDFNLTGILAALAAPLAQAAISIFAVSTFDTDYMLLKQSRLDDAVAALRAAGHTIN